MNTATMHAKIDRGERHGVPGQLNVCVLDTESDCTGFGRHNRLVGPFGGTGADRHIITLREDLVTGLPLSTEADRRKVLNGWGRMHPRGSRLTYVSSTPYTTRTGDSIEHEYHIVNTRIR